MDKEIINNKVKIFLNISQLSFSNIFNSLYNGETKWVSKGAFRTFFFGLICLALLVLFKYDSIVNKIYYESLKVGYFLKGNNIDSELQKSINYVDEQFYRMFINYFAVSFYWMTVIAIIIEIKHIYKTIKKMN